MVEKGNGSEASQPALDPSEYISEEDWEAAGANPLTRPCGICGAPRGDLSTCPACGME